MNYAKFLTGDLVMPPRKRAARMVLALRRIGGAYRYIVIGPQDAQEEYWEHELTRVSRAAA